MDSQSIIEVVTSEEFIAITGTVIAIILVKMKVGKENATNLKDLVTKLLRSLKKSNRGK